MINHPLTDEICKTVCCTWPEEHETSLVFDNMRAGADWQLERVIRYLENDLEFVLWTDDFMDKFNKAMRPTTT